MTVALDPEVVLFEHAGLYHRGEMVGMHVVSCHEVDVRSEIVIGALDDCSPEALCERCFPRRVVDDEMLWGCP